MKSSRNWVAVPLTLIVIIMGGLLISYYNFIQVLDEKQQGTAAEVINQYQRRADLMGNLMNTVQQYTNHEQRIFADITASRSALHQLNMHPEKFQDEASIKHFEKIQAELKTELARLIVLVENYPELRSSELYRNLMVQLEGTENRITVARHRHIDAVREYNTTLRQVPYIFLANVFGYAPLPQMSVSNPQIESSLPMIEVRD